MTESNYIHPTEAMLAAIDVHTLLPQQEPFVMVGVLTGFDEKLTETRTVIGKDNIFVEDDCFTPSGLIENIAQTCAARIGYVNKYILRKGLQIGYIGAIRNLEVFSLPKTGQCITTRMEVLEAVFDMILARVEVFCEGETIAATEMKIAVAKQQEQ